MNTELTVLLPLFQEREVIGTMLTALETALSSQPLKWRVLVLDDGPPAPDAMDYWSAVKARFKFLDVCCFHGREGKDASIYWGLWLADSPMVLVMDGDMQHPPGLIPEMIAQMKQGQVDLVEGQKLAPLPRVWYLPFRLLFFLLASLFLFKGFWGSTDFKLLGSKAIKQARSLHPEGFFLRTAFMKSKSIKSKALVFQVQDRAAGSTKFKTLPLFLLACAMLKNIVFPALLETRSQAEMQREALNRALLLAGDIQ